MRASSKDGEPQTGFSGANIPKAIRIVQAPFACQNQKKGRNGEVISRNEKGRSKRPFKYQRNGS